MDIITGDSLDKVNPRLGYSRGNLALACAVCNITKSNIFTGKEMREIAQEYIKPKWINL